MAPNLIIHLQPFLHDWIWLCLFPFSASRTISGVSSLRGNVYKQTKQKNKGGKKCGPWASGWALTYFTHLQTLCESISASATVGKGWGILISLKKGMNNRHTKNQRRLWKLQERLILLMTKLPWYVLCAKIPFHFHHTQNQNYHCRKRYKLCSLCSIRTSQIVSHATWRCAPETDQQCFNYLGCRQRQNKSLRSSQKVLSKLCCFQMETTRTWPKL